MIEQLKNLLDECRYMAAGGDPIWLADVQALESVSYTHLTLPTICSV